MSVSRFSLIIALLPSLNMQKMRQNEPLFALISYRTWHIMAKDIAMYLLNQYILFPLSSYCPTPGLVLSKPCRRIVQVLTSYSLFVCVATKTPIFKQKYHRSFRFLNLFTIFATSFRNYSGGTE